MPRIESCRGVYPIPRFGNCEVSIKLSREELSRSATRDLEDRIWQARLGLPIPFLPYHRSAPVAAASFREAIEHFSLGQRILANGVSYFPTLGRLLEECGHYWLWPDPVFCTRCYESVSTDSSSSSSPPASSIFLSRLAAATNSAGVW